MSDESKIRPNLLVKEFKQVTLNVTIRRKKMKQKKKSLFCLVLAVLAVAFAFSGTADASSKKRIGVVAFENASQVRDEAFGGGMADMLIYELIRNRNYDLIERSQMAKLEAEIADSNFGGFIDERNAPQLGKLAALDYIVMGRVIEASAWEAKGSTTTIAIGGGGGTTNTPTTQTTVKVLINVRVLDVEGGRIVLSENGESELTVSTPWDSSRVNSFALYSNAAREAISKVAHQILTRIEPMEATVLMFRNKEVTIDIGREDGIRDKQRLKIVKEGETLIGRDGMPVGVEIIEVAEIEITRTEMTTSVGKIIRRFKERVTEVDSKGKEKQKNVDIPILNGHLVRPMQASEGGNFWNRK